MNQSDWIFVLNRIIPEPIRLKPWNQSHGSIDINQPINFKKDVVWQITKSCNDCHCEFQPCIKNGSFLAINKTHNLKNNGKTGTKSSIKHHQNNNKNQLFKRLAKPDKFVVRVYDV